MSVAFRRESDDEHLEPKFEIPIPPGPNLVTARGLALIEERVSALEAKLAALVDSPANAPSITAVKRDLRYWQTRQVTAERVPVPSGKTGAIGTTVNLRIGGKVKVVTIVGNDEADPAAGRIAFSAPLARVLIGAQPGDLLDFAGKDEAIEVLAIAVTA